MEELQTKSLATFQAGIRAACRGLFLSQLTTLDFADAMYSAIRRGFEQAWQEGSESCGILANERTQEETKQLGLMIGDNFQYVAGLADWIFQHSKANGGSWEAVASRATGWIARYEEVKIVAREMACKDQKEVWRIGHTERSCCDCLRLNGRVYRNSTWHKWGIHPKSSALNCFGIHCDCRREKTDLPITKGRPPNLRGPGGCGKGSKKKESIQE